MGKIIRIHGYKSFVFLICFDSFFWKYQIETSPRRSDGQLRQVSELVALLGRLYMVDEVPGWVPASRSPKRMRTKPKRYFADPSIAVGLMGMSPASLLMDWQTFGLAFENLCMRDLDVYARALPDAASTPLRYYRDDSGLEVDAVVECADGRWGAFEVKLSQAKVDEAARTLLRLQGKLLKPPASRMVPPSFLCVLTGWARRPTSARMEST